MCLDWLRKAPLDLTQASQADSLSQKIYSMSETAPNKGVNLMNIYIRLDACRREGGQELDSAEKFGFMCGKAQVLMRE